MSKTLDGSRDRPQGLWVSLKAEFYKDYGQYLFVITWVPALALAILAGWMIRMGADIGMSFDNTLWFIGWAVIGIGPFVFLIITSARHRALQRMSVSIDRSPAHSGDQMRCRVEVTANGTQPLVSVTLVRIERVESGDSPRRAVAPVATATGQWTEAGGIRIWDGMVTIPADADPTTERLRGAYRLTWALQVRCDQAGLWPLTETFLFPVVDP